MTSRPTALLAALDVEASALARNLPRSNATSPNLQVWEGTIENESVVLVVTGVGKVAAAMAAQFVCDAHRPQAIISIGLAGGVGKNDERGTLVVPTGAMQHDFDARPLVKKRAELPDFNLTTFMADHALAERLRTAALKSVERPDLVVSGVILTGDQIMSRREIRDGVLAEFPAGVCFDMETAAIAHVAFQNQVPWGGLRITSDSADETFDQHEVLGFGAASAAELFDRVIARFLRAS